MLFKKPKRVIYNKSALDKAICQLRFPPILRIDSTIPSDFQDKLREKFPLYQQSSGFLQALLPIVNPSLDQVAMQGTPPVQVTKNHQFADSGGVSLINLTRTFLAYTTTQYLRWEEFRESLILIESIFREAYSPSFYTRIGLRYIDVIRRSRLGLTGVPWQELLNPVILGFLGADGIPKAVIGIDSTSQLRMEKTNALLRMNCALVQDVADTGKEELFQIDADYSTDVEGRVPPEDCIEALNYLHEEAHGCIQWCLLDKLHRAMEPMEI